MRLERFCRMTIHTDEIRSLHNSKECSWDNIFVGAILRNVVCTRTTVLTSDKIFGGASCLLVGGVCFRSKIISILNSQLNASNLGTYIRKVLNDFILHFELSDFTVNDNFVLIIYIEYTLSKDNLFRIRITLSMYVLTQTLHIYLLDLIKIGCEIESYATLLYGSVWHFVSSATKLKSYCYVLYTTVWCRLSLGW